MISFDTTGPTIALVCGARPNFVKVAALYHALRASDRGCEPVIVHTGQHFSYDMSEVFFQELGLPGPDVHLDVGSGTHAEQTARAMVGVERFLKLKRPSLMICVGDVNSTLAASLAASKCHVTSAHVEAGLRSNDRDMPEEINRIVADHVCDWLYTTCMDADENLRREGIDPERIVFVGNVMADTLERHTLPIAISDIPERLELNRGEYVVMTMHRPEAVDDPEVVTRLVEIIARVCEAHRLVFPMHPRTRQGFVTALGSEGWHERIGGQGVTICEPLGYVDFLALQRSAHCVLTDSGGVQEETTLLGVPCLTLRPNTERPVTVTHGTNRVVGLDPDDAIDALQQVNKHTDGGTTPLLWDGHAAERIVDHIFTAVLGIHRDTLSGIDTISDNVREVISELSQSDC